MIWPHHPALPFDHFHMSLAKWERSKPLRRDNPALWINTVLLSLASADYGIRQRGGIH